MDSSPKFLVVFDIDGVIVDSRRAVEESYAEAGVTMPDWAWGRPWQDWLVKAVGGGFIDAKHVHDEKQRLYLKRIRNGDIDFLPPSIVVRVLEEAADTQVAFATGSSRVTAEAILARLGLDPMNYQLGTTLTAEGKSEFIRSLHKRMEWPAVLIDDNEYVGQIVSRSSRRRFIHYTGQDHLQLWGQIWTQ